MITTRILLRIGLGLLATAAVILVGVPVAGPRRPIPGSRQRSGR